jgi:hypothetical protein
MYVYLSRNQISGTIPEALGNIVTLQQVGMKSPFCMTLIALGLDSNALTGTIPPNFGLKQAYLQSFFVQKNKLSGHFDGNLCHVRFI